MLQRLTTGVQETWDTYCSALYYPVVCVLFLLVVVYNGWYGQKLAADWEQWTIAEWLISYAPGFVRRGLSGEVLIFVSRFSGWPANQVVLGTLVLLFAMFFVLFAILLRRKQMTFWYFAMCLSPGFVLFTFYNSSAVGRKESLVFLVFSIWALMSAGWRRGSGLHLAFGILCFLVTLMHEVFFFVTPYFVLLSYFVTQREGGGRQWLKSLVVPLCSGLALLLILGFSASLNDPALCDRLMGMGAPATVCGGVLEYHHMPPMEALTDFLARLDTRALLGAGLVFPIVLIPLYLFLSANVPVAISPLRLTAIETLVIIFSGPLFVLAVDWGRWVSIHVVLVTISCALFLPEKGRPRLPMRTLTPSLASLVVGLLVLTSMLGWSVNYCCGADIVKAFGPVKSLVSVWEEFEL